MLRLQGFAPFPGGSDAFMTGFATDVLQQQGTSYIQRGQAFMQQRMGFMSTDVMHYFFNLNTEYGAQLHICWSPRYLCWTSTQALCEALHHNCGVCSEGEAADAGGTIPAAVELHQSP
jgi:hypothetical protein